MACKRQALVIFLLSLFTFSFSHHDNGGGIAVYWGQDSREDDLRSTCDSGNYAIVLLAFLNRFGSGRTPSWQFLGHCDYAYEGGKRCTELESEIKHCQAKGIKVLLSIGGHPALSDYSLNSTEDAKEVANYLYTNFLSGQFGPLGSVYLDGIDFNIQVTTDHWEDLTRELDFFRRTKGRYFHLSAVPRCPIPVSNLGRAIETKLFDNIFIVFFDNPSCESSFKGDTTPLLDSWDNWVELVASNNSLFVGLPASITAAGTGYVPPTLVNRVVLPHVKRASNYGGVMLWNRFRDLRSNFSGRILPNVLKSPLLYATSVSDA